MLNLIDISINMGISSLKRYKYRYLYPFRELIPILIDTSSKLSISKKLFGFTKTVFPLLSSPGAYYFLKVFLFAIFQTTFSFSSKYFLISALNCVHPSRMNIFIIKKIYKNTGFLSLSFSCLKTES